VRIYVVVYKEVTETMTMSSRHTKVFVKIKVLWMAIMTMFDSTPLKLSTRILP